MKLTLEETHAPRLKRGVNRCIKCKQVDPDLTKPCPKWGEPVEPAGTKKRKKR